MSIIKDTVGLLAAFGSTKYDEANIRSIAINELKIEERALALELVLELKNRQLSVHELDAARTLKARIRSIRQAFRLY